MPKAEVPGFRKGHAPRKLVQTRFRKEVAEQVKSELLVDSIAQVNEEEGLSAISEPDLDLDSIELPDEGPMTFEFDLEVRPNFEMPKWKGLDARAAGARVRPGRRRRRAGEPAGPLRPAGSPRGAGGRGGLRDLQHHVPARGRGPLPGDGAVGPHPSRAEPARRQHREVRRADGGGRGRPDARGHRPAHRRRPQRGSAGPGRGGRVRGARSQAAGAAGAHGEVPRGDRAGSSRRATCATPSPTTSSAAWNTASANLPASRSRPC